MTIRARIEARLPEWDIANLPFGPDATAGATRTVRHGGTDHDVPVYDRPSLATGQKLAGPAVLEQEDTTIWILPGWSAETHETGTLILQKDS